MKTREISDSILRLQQEIEKITDPIAVHITSELLNLIEILTCFINHFTLSVAVSPFLKIYLKKVYTTFG